MRKYNATSFIKMEFKSIHNGIKVGCSSKSYARFFLFFWLIIVVVEFYNIKPHNDVSACNNGRDIHIITC